MVQNTVCVTADNEPSDETLPDLASPALMFPINDNLENNITEDEDDAAEALLQLSQTDMIMDDETKLPLGTLPVDTAPVPIVLGNQDVLNAIENLKQSETGNNTTNLEKDTEQSEPKNKA